MDKNQFYKELVFEKRDIARIDKLFAVYEKGNINKENFWDKTQYLCKNIMSDHAIKRWQIISECFYKYILGGA